MIILISGIKGGTGKSTIAFHLAVEAYLNKNEIITIDTDSPQNSFTRYYENRKKNKNLPSIWQTHITTNNINEFNFEKDKTYLIDTPGRYDNEIKKLHEKADIIITPVNDSFVDMDTIMQIQHDKWILPGYYCEMIFANKKFNQNSKWFLVRNRSASINSKHKKLFAEKVNTLSSKLNFEFLDGLKERTVFRELFQEGLTVLDIKRKLSVSNLAAKMEIKMIWKKITKAMKEINTVKS